MYYRKEEINEQTSSPHIPLLIHRLLFWMLWSCLGEVCIAIGSQIRGNTSSGLKTTAKLLLKIHHMNQTPTMNIYLYTVHSSH